jgi:hypothetical protein
MAKVERGSSPRSYVIKESILEKLAMVITAGVIRVLRDRDTKTTEVTYLRRKAENCRKAVQEKWADRNGRVVYNEHMVALREANTRYEYLKGKQTLSEKEEDEFHLLLSKVDDLERSTKQLWERDGDRYRYDDAVAELKEAEDALDKAEMELER